MLDEIRTSRTRRRAGAVVRAPLGRALGAAAFLVGVASGCGGDADRATQTAGASASPAPETEASPAAPADAAPAGPAPAAEQSPPATPAAEGPASSEGTAGRVPLEPSPPPGDDAAGAPASPAAAPESEEDTPAPAEAPAVFNPCPTDGTPCQIMPLGDSITFGFIPFSGASEGGYRVELFRQAVLDGHPLTFVGRVSNGPDEVQQQPFPQGNEGYSGITISGLADTQLEAALGAADPDIILLHIGTNDMIQAAASAAAPANLERLLDRITALEPEALVVVATIIPLGFGADAVPTYNAALTDIVQERIDAGEHLMLVDMFTPYAATNLAERLPDNVHPDVTGYALMAQTWYAAIESFLQ